MTNLIKHFENRLIPSSLQPFDLMFRNFFDTDSFFTPLLNSVPKYPIDITETENGVKFEFATPGLCEDDINITITDGDVLNVSYDKESTEENKNEKIIHKGIARRSFNMGWKITSRFNLDELKASMNNGLLTIEIPHSPEVKPKKIAIESSKKRAIESKK